MIMREIHIHIPSGFAVGQELHIHLDEAGPEPQSALSQHQPAPSDPIEEMLHRLEDSPSASPQLRDTVAELQAIGYRLGLPKPHRTTGQMEKYIRFIDPAAPTSGTAIMRPAFLIFTRTSDWEVLARLPGAILRDKGDVKFPIDGQHELEAARKVKR
jgi:hypothetical protein